MIQNDSASARERRLVRNLSNQTERAISAILLGIDALPLNYQVLALDQALRLKLREWDRHETEQRRVA
jgi:hypothetical protein